MANEQYSLKMPKEFKNELKKLATEENRSLNGFILNAIKEYIKNNYPDMEKSYKEK